MTFYIFIKGEGMISLKHFLFVIFSITAVMAFGCDQRRTENAEEPSQTSMMHHQQSSSEMHTMQMPEQSGNDLTVQTLCPIMKAPVNKNLFVDRDGLRIYICCEGCRQELTHNFADYRMMLETMGQKPEVL